MGQSNVFVARPLNMLHCSCIETSEAAMPQKPCPQAILIDLAGVLHTGNTPIPGSLAAMRQLRAAGIPLRFLTNTTRSPARTIVAKLTLMRFDIQAGELQTAVIATR
jgi:hypothetical protein